MIWMRGFLCVALLWSSACGEDAPNAGDGDTGTTLGGSNSMSDGGGLGEGGTPEGGVTGASTQIDPSQIPAAFAAYDAPSCGSLGQSCSLVGGSTCEGALCNLEVEVCLPQIESVFSCVPGGCDAAAPYCLGGQCLDFDSASCVCGAADLSECGAPAVSALGAQVQPDGSVCLAQGGRCGGEEYTCCDGLECQTGSDGSAVCRAPCGASGDTCGGATRCCDETALECVRFDGETDFTCHALCTNEADCGAGCCVPLNDGSGTAVCRAAELCPGGGSCVEEGATCSADVACCEELTCVVASGAVTGSCAARCSTGADCASACCVPFSSAEGGFCGASADCL